MTLYLETSEGFAPWNGQPIAGILHPRDIGRLWSAAELEAVGLYAPAEAAPVPEGKRVTSTGVQRVEGVVRSVHALEDIPPIEPADIVLSDRQLRLGLIAAGVLPSAVRSAIEAAVTDPLEREAMLTWFDYTRDIRWDHPVTQQLMAVAGFTPEAAEAMWLGAASIEA